MLYVNGKPISKKDIPRLNEEIQSGSEQVEKIIISDAGNVLIYTKEYLKTEK